MAAALEEGSRRPGGVVSGGAVSAQRTHRARPRGLRQINRDRLPTKTVNLVVGLDDEALHTAGDPDLSLSAEGLLIHVGVEQDAAAELRALDRPHPPPVRPVRRIPVIVLDGDDERPLLGTRLASLHRQDVGLARPRGVAASNAPANAITRPTLLTA